MGRRHLLHTLIVLAACNADPRDDATSITGNVNPSTTTGGGSTGDDGGGSEGDSGDSSTGDEGDPAGGYTCASTMLLPSSIGCSFVAGLHVEGGVVMVNMGAEVATVSISDGAGTEQQIEIEPGGADTVIWAPPNVEGGVFTGIVRFIDSDQPLQAWQFTPPTPGFDNDASILLPTTTLGTKHRLAAYTGNPIGDPGGGLTKGAFQTLVVHATEDDTRVTVSLKASAAKTSEFSAMNLDVAAGSTTGTVTMQRGETLVLSDSFELYDGPPQDFDWTGSVVESNKPIAVYMSSISMVPWDFAGLAPDWICCQDTMSAAVPPTSVLGTRYAAVKTIQLGEEFDVFRVVANEDDTHISVSGDESHTYDLAEGEFAEFRTKGAVVVEGNKAFVMAQYLTSSHVGQPDSEGGIETEDCGHVETPGDPGMSILFAADNWLNEYRFVQGAAGVGVGWCYDHATITSALSSWSEIRLAGEALPDPTRIGDSELGYVRVPLTEDLYDLTAPAGVGVQLDVYGFRDDGSYIYPGGVRLDAINPEG